MPLFFFGSLLTPELDELVVEVVAFARPLADAGEHRITAVRLGDVVDQFLDDDGLADAGAAEQADFAALGIRCEQVDHLDTGAENFRLGRLFGIGGGVGVDRTAFGVGNVACLVDRIADYVHDAAKRAVANRHRDRDAGIRHLLSADEPFRRVHRDGAHCRLAEMLGDFQHQTGTLVLGFQRVQDRWQMPFELHIDDGADDLSDPSN